MQLGRRQIACARVDGRIGANVRLVNEAGVENADGPDGSYYIRDRIILVPKNSTVKDGTVI